MPWSILKWLGLGPVPLSPATEERLNVLFSGAERARAKEILSWLPSSFPKDPVALERIRFALLRLSNGSVSDLEDWMDELRADVRTVLIESGFWHDGHAHESWFPTGAGLETRPPLSERTLFTKEDAERLRRMADEQQREKRNNS
jgi:hypothetical protein